MQPSSLLQPLTVLPSMPDAEEAFLDAQLTVYSALAARADDLADMALRHLAKQHELLLARADTELHTLAAKRRLNDLAVQRAEAEVAAAKNPQVRALVDRLDALERQLPTTRRPPADALSDALPEWIFEQGPQVSGEAPK
jgi:uncharacterized protein YjiS (DUF1127 family)